MGFIRRLLFPSAYHQKNAFTIRIRIPLTAHQIVKRRGRKFRVLSKSGLNLFSKKFQI
ncbi:hypothetical protein LEP1GSC043_2728 [Leptospira weilii str. Ecochallenge]|uniref:Uncharacterized protein n=1 Tax=Leptospira weilii str. Ecochallenge TaxID=1049986 RepID=N1TXM0_9LEPT|nr:hypothetical protein LEP1GSC043_2728 [Leptospira weilii str. Ecochallenge]